MWEKVFERAFLLHTNPRPQIIVHRQFQSGLLAIEISKTGGWDYSHIAWLVPIVYLPQVTNVKADGKWKRLYVGRQILKLSPEDKLGSIEIRPKLWIPDINVRIWEFTGFIFDEQQALERIEQKIDDLAAYGNP